MWFILKHNRRIKYQKQALILKEVVITSELGRRVFFTTHRKST
jgi:hypothetical protein